MLFVSTCILPIFLLLNYLYKSSAMISVVDQNGTLVKSFIDKQALYSATILETYKGLVGACEPSNACNTINRPHFFTNDTILRFVLINGTSSRDCASYLRARNAESAGYDLAIIYGVDYWQEMYVIKPEVGIAVRYITLLDGLIIREKFLYNNESLSRKVYFLLVSPIPDDISYYIKLFSIIIGVCVVIMLFFMICLLIKCIQERRRSRRNRLSSRQIRQLPTETFKTGDSYDVCAICLEDFKDGDKLRILPCSHAYHSRCIDPWLMENKRNCPLCKRKVHFGDSSSGSDSESEDTPLAEDTPLIPPGSPQANNWGTFVSQSLERHGILETSGHYNINRDVDSATIASTDGSINSNASGQSFDCHTAEHLNTSAGNRHLPVV